MEMEDVLFSGFLTKSPPERKINRARWQRRWFVLKRTETNVFLQYYKDQNSTKPKGTIDLNSCSQVDQGLTFESRRSLAKAFIFDVVTPKRKYFLVSNTEADMVKWVHEICCACGFQLEEHEGDPDQQTSPPPNVTDSPSCDTGKEFPPSPAELLPSETPEPYIPLDACMTGHAISQSVPTGGNFENQIREEVDRPKRSESVCSVPSDYPPSRLSSVRDSTAMDNYAVPPAHPRFDSSSSSSSSKLYDVPPGLLKRESSFQNQDDIFKPVASPWQLESPFSPSPDVHQSNGHMRDLYDTPPTREPLSVYDVPPVAHPLIRDQNVEISHSTDRLARDFKEISVRNSFSANGDSALNEVEVPVTPTSVKNATDLFIFPGGEDSAGAPPRPPKRSSVLEAPNERSDEATPPRPPKPEYLSTPSFDEMYDQLPGSRHLALSPIELENKLQQSPSNPVYATPPSSGWIDTHSPPAAGNMWLDCKVPTPSMTGHSYINSAQPTIRHVAPPPIRPGRPGSYLNMKAASVPNQQATFQIDERCTDLSIQQTNYMLMMGSTDAQVLPTNKFQYPDNSQYIAMHGANRNGNTHLPPGYHRRTFSGVLPPPVDRSLKPDRKTSESGLQNIGMTGSFYATTDDIIPIQASRTQSFSRHPVQYEKLDLDRDCFRSRTNTGDSTTSSSDDDLYTAGSDQFFPKTASVPEEDTYIYKDVSPRRISSQEGPRSTPIPMSQPIQQKDDIEYLELSHDHDEEPLSPPPRPPKSSLTTNVQYIDLDHQRMKALKQVTMKREEELQDVSVGGGRGTLTKRDM